jgi:hypothetical protein
MLDKFCGLPSMKFVDRTRKVAVAASARMIAKRIQSSAGRSVVGLGVSARRGGEEKTRGRPTR